MIGFTFIGSGSRGNSALIELGENKYLLDAGLSCRRIITFLQERNISVEDLNGILITHEHSDHINGLRVLLKKYPEIPIFCTKGTYNGITEKFHDILLKNHVAISAGKAFNLGKHSCIPFEVSHDAAEPVGFRIEAENKVITAATDFGRVTPEVLEYSADADLLCIESNYDEEMLRSCRYPYWLKTRINGPKGHLPNKGVRGILSRMHKIPQDLVLMHISQDSNTPALARESLSSFLDNEGYAFKKTKVHLTSQDFAGDCIILNNKPGDLYEN